MNIFTYFSRSIDLDYVIIHLIEIIKQQLVSILKWRNSLFSVYQYHYKSGIQLVKNDSNVLLVIDLHFINIIRRDFFYLAAYYRGAHVIIGVFDMNELTSLVSAEKWINEALQTTSVDNPLIFLVGTKRDLIVNFLVFSLVERFDSLLDR